MISVIDYGLGNLRAFLNVYDYLGFSAGLAKTPDDIKNSSHLILPGVGTFDRAMRLLDESGMKNAILEAVQVKNTPILGVCVGMQILGNSSDEGSSNGLGLIDAEIKLINFCHKQTQSKLPVPHMGWNKVSILKDSELFTSNLDQCEFYFLHSYHFECNEPENICAVSEYGGDIICGASKENIFGVQFHPEKSHLAGTELLKNFSQL